MTITIKTAYDEKGEQYWFAQNEKGEFFGSSLLVTSFFESTILVRYRYSDIDTLKKDLEAYKKNREKPKEVETFEL